MKNNGKGKAWMMFGLGTILCLVSLVVAPQWVWVPLPFVCTGLALAFDAI